MILGARIDVYTIQNPYLFLIVSIALRYFAGRRFPFLGINRLDTASFPRAVRGLCAGGMSVFSPCPAILRM